jgi:cytochrome c2
MTGDQAADMMCRAFAGQEVAMSRFVLPLVALAVVSLVACGDSGPRKPRRSAEDIAMEKMIAKGRAAFDANGCQECHVVDEAPVVKNPGGPDLTYYGNRGAGKGGFGYVTFILTPGNKPQDHAKLGSAQQRADIAKFLDYGCRLEGYVRPERRTHVCPVTGIDVVPGVGSTVQRTYGGRTVYLASPSAAAKFDLDPGHFSTRR